MAFKKTQFKGFVFSTLNKCRPGSHAEAFAYAMRVWGDRVPLHLLREWTEFWWSKRPTLVCSSPQLVHVPLKEEVTLSQLKVAQEFDSLVTRLNLSTDDVLTLFKCVGVLGGVERAFEIVEELRKLQRRSRAPEPSLFDGIGLSDLDDVYPDVGIYSR
jgi:hypothetical protein